ncbi:MAG: DUF3011 domain-containing protein [Parvularcula sp.]|nr:DUF3011 domain-containing protein [Parvularcula sp.]
MALSQERALTSCSSRDGRYAICELPRGFGNVRLVSQRSSRNCIENQTWGLGRSGVWVDRGCRAEFSFTYPVRLGGRGRDDDWGRDEGWRRDDGRDDDWRGRRDDDWRRDEWGRQRGWEKGRGRGYGRDRATEIGFVNCSSRDDRYRLCRIDAVFDRVQIERRASDSACVKGRDWGTTRSGIWVDNGCRAQFSFAYRLDRRDRYRDLYGD